MMLDHREAQRLLRERWETPVGALDVTRVTRTAADGGEPLPLDEVGFRIVEIIAHQNAAERELLALLADFDERRGWAPNYTSCVDWLVHNTGEASVTCRERLRVARLLRNLPETSAAMARGELGISKVRELTRQATPENEKELVKLGRHATVEELKRVLSGYRIHSRKGEAALAEWQQEQRRLAVHPEVSGMYKLFGELPPEAGALVMRALEHFGRQLHGTNTDVSAAQRFADALVHALELALAADARSADGQAMPTSGTRPAHTTVNLHVDAATLAGEEHDDDRCHLADGVRVTRISALRMLCDASLAAVLEAPDGTILAAGRKTRTISPALRRALDARDGRCRFPHCENRMTDAHHIVHWAEGGETTLENLILLCRHHHTLVHERGFTVEVTSRGQVRFRTPGGTLVPEQPDAVALAGRIEGALLRRNRARGVDPWGWAPAVLSRKVPWEVEVGAMDALDPKG